MRPLPLPVARGIDTALDKAVVPGFTRLGPAVRRRLPTWPEDARPGALAGRTAAVTGATSGLGLATAEGLARLGAHVRLVVRDTDKGERVRQQLLRDVPGAVATVDRCDVADLEDVRRFAADLDAALDGGRLDVLVHNAGALPAERTESPQGHELTMAVHVLGPVLMTELLRDRLAGSADSRDARVVLVTSGGMYAQPLRADDPEYTRGSYSGTTAYARSKRAQVELLPVLASRWAGQRIGAHATHPGWADTPGVVDSLPGFHRVTGPLLRDAAQGADTTVWLAATEPTPPSGRLWHDRRARSPHLLPRRTRTRPADRDRMWSWVREATGLD
ncbi:SDR family NAD(P)-dependent oxidoreductase [Nocardioides aurantiacus]|uniref:NAD(P)-dependent dehydrogenase (Short-subunit alcohol dehydrogenase family) n=1 Tax=Nocardioides aurantiacus TaxID=86796 RepID=A0A3N2CZA4_9ACTN|nr:SDR family NAD(P)-dependent oxidoreductase [Nocardioides aurantiacus]ROR92860.1 NAD(P)-dependent dehydrogenase (short-subunit alcohol dehydrogenase family) [Nocardioides aurantiacus]